MRAVLTRWLPRRRFRVRRHRLGGSAGSRVVWRGVLNRFRLLVSLCTIALGWGIGGVAYGEQVAPGVTHTVYNASGPNVVYVVAIDKYKSEYKLKVGYAQAKRNYTARERTSVIAGRYDNPPSHDVLAAVNAAFFDPSNPPRLLGIGQSDGEMLDVPSFNSSYTYHTVMVGPQRQPVVRTNFNHLEGALTFADGTSIPLTQYNFYMNGPLVPINGVTAFTPAFDSSTRTDFSVSPSLAVEVILSDVTYPMRSNKEVSGIVTAIRTGTASSNNAIPADGMVISSWGSPKTTIVARTQVGDRLRMKFLTAADEYNNSDNAVTGIGWVIHNGAAYTSGWQNLESGAAPYGRNPRTVLAWNNDTWFMVVCDGRSGTSVGMTFQEMSDFLTGTLGALDGVNYDGGGSSTMWVNGSVRNVPSDGSERAVANAIMLVKHDTSTVFPFSDPFASTGRLAGWDDKFTYNEVMPFSPSSPGGDGYVIRVMDPTGGVETTRRGDFGDTNYAVQADVYCEYRPGDAGDGYERCGLFARDSGSGAFGLSTFGGGNCYPLTYDSGTGRVQAGKYVNGTLTDFLASPLYMPSTAWRRLRIECFDESITYLVDGSPIASVSDGTFPRGYFGIGYHEFFTTNSNIHGTRADNFSTAALGLRPGKATNPSPANAAGTVGLDADLSWTAGLDADSHVVYFGATSPGDPQGSQTGTTFDPGPLLRGVTYYWRIDEVNANGTTTGDVWHFRTEYYLGDLDGDGDVDQEDWGGVQSCLTDVAVPSTDPACDAARLDGDEDIDPDDITIFIACYSGPNIPAPANCKR